MIFRINSVAGEKLGYRQIIDNVDTCLETGFYITARNTIGLPEGINEVPLLVFRINGNDAFQMFFYAGNLYIRLYWHKNLLEWNKFKNSSLTIA